MVILLVLLIIGALVFLALGIVSAVQYGKMTGVKAVDTEGAPLPTTMGSDLSRSREEMNNENVIYRKEAYIGKGKEAGVSFSISYDDLKKGLKENNPLNKKQFHMAAGFLFFTSFTMAAIGVGIIMGSNGLGYVFIAAGLLVGGAFSYKMLF